MGIMLRVPHCYCNSFRFIESFSLYYNISCCFTWTAAMPDSSLVFHNVSNHLGQKTPSNILLSSSFLLESEWKYWEEISKCPFLISNSLGKSHTATLQLYSYLRFYRQEPKFILFIFIKANSSVLAQMIQLSEADERRNMFSIKTTLNLEKHSSPSAAILQLVLCSRSCSYEEVSYQISWSCCHNR